METEFVAFSVLIIEHLLIKVNNILNYKIFLAFYTIIAFTDFIQEKSVLPDWKAIRLMFWMSENIF
jgi:hypothetical protein